MKESEPGSSPLLDEGIERFNEGRFWDAHESWETLWLDSDEPEKTFLQGLIQLTAAFHHFQRGTLSGGVRLVDTAVEKLSAYPPGFMGVVRSDAVEAAMTARRRADVLLSQGRGDEALSGESLSTASLARVEDEHRPRGSE